MKLTPDAGATAQPGRGQRAASPSAAPRLLPKRQGQTPPNFGQSLATARREPSKPAPTSATKAPATGPAAGIAARASQYEPLIQKYSQQSGVDPALVRAVIQVESGWDPKAVSPAGAMGLMQLMPANCQQQRVTDPFDPEQNIRAGVAQLAWGLKQYKGDTRLALAAYNAGPGAVAKYGGVPPYEETQRYVRLVTEAVDAQRARQSSVPAR